MSLRLHFTFGPVQEFVSEARKTADLWTGSYLISYLAAHAIHGALKVGAKEEDFFPRITDNPLLEAVRDPNERPADPTNRAASVGSLPNRFSVKVGSSEQGKELAVAAKIELDSAWRRVSEACRTHLENYADLHTQTWDRQVSSLWEISWVVAEDPRALARRKLLRAFEPVSEPGRKCTVCGRREELQDSASRKNLSRDLGTGFLGDKERLCAVCLIKRTIPRIGEKAFGWKIYGNAFSSTPDLAADPWRRKVIVNEDTRTAREAFATVAGRPFEQLEGGYFYPAYHEELVGASKSKELGERLSALYRIAAPPRPTYAILAMDGDNMGTRLSQLDDSGRLELSKQILEFSHRVREAVEDGKSKSRLIYAGGEDVFALLSMDRALEAAWKVRSLYKETFEEFDKTYGNKLGNSPSTISAGLLFCPMTLPLRAAVREAHRLLDEEAKDKAGRDALAVGVWKGGGEALNFARQWDQWVEQLMEMVGREASPYPSRFLYQAREIARGPADDVAIQKELLALEYYGSREERFEVEDMEQARKRVRPLIEMSRKGESLDPALFRLVRFFFEGA